MKQQEIQVQMQLSSIAQVTDMTDCLLKQLQQQQICPEKQMDIRLCLMEAVQNALLYGCPDDRPDAYVQVRWQCTEQGFVFSVEDQGPGVPEALRQQTGIDLSMEEHGRGLLLLQAILDEVQFSKNGNCITGRLRW